MDLNERRARILKEIISDFIETGKPVGSVDFLKKHNMSLSSATIRNEMAALEQLDYLSHPHTSAGRMPTSRGYRMYVDHLMEEHKLSQEEMSRIKSGIDLQSREFEGLICEAAETLSSLTHYTSWVMTPKISKIFLKNIELLQFDTNSIAIILYTSTDTVEHKLLKLNFPVSRQIISELSETVNRHLTGVYFEDLNEYAVKNVFLECRQYIDLAAFIMKNILILIDGIKVPKVNVFGVSNLFNYDEYKDIEKAKRLLSYLEDSNHLKNLFAADFANEIKIIIGDENENPEIAGCSIIAGKYLPDERSYGIIGIIGPTRMDYKRAVTTLDFTLRHLNKTIIKYFYSDNKRLKW